MPDATHDLNRFVQAQADRHSYQHAVDELRRGHKTSHWMWFVFPQFAGLGQSATSRYFAISSREEAAAYLAHPVLGARLRECAALVVDANARNAGRIFGSIDAQKLHSSMTLFGLVDPAEPTFTAVLDRYFGGRPDPATVRLLG